MRGGLTAAAPAMAPFSIQPMIGMDRLNGPDRPPICVALSGGGDSLALLHLAKAWADGAGRSLVALTVDHDLQPTNAAWSRFAAERAARLGVGHRTLVWRGAKPPTGLPAAARAARHALLAAAARSTGARVILMAHTADDLMEAEIMRRMGASTPSPRFWSPSPAWPEGRGVFLLRPLLGHRRADLRALLVGLGETWIDDPANDDPRFSRTLARRRITGSASAPAPPDELAPPAGWRAIQQGLAGEFTAPRELFAAADRRLIGALALCAAGTARPPTPVALDRIAARIAGDDFTSSLGGARIEGRGDRIQVFREAGESVRGGLQAADLPLGESVFDGRFLVAAHRPGYRVTPLRGHAARLRGIERERLKAIPAPARGALPTLISPSGGVFCPILAPHSAVAMAPLGLARLEAALGAVQDEATAHLGVSGGQAP
ncbi:MAG TPA: tRNA lysidine(34) synthetase TilS [Caulobacteraceae bacterium]|nr:tRNA lysidine(34) synthetase TilS [Caulobacteraceae bacterium]